MSLTGYLIPFIISSSVHCKYFVIFKEVPKDGWIPANTLHRKHFWSLIPLRYRWKELFWTEFFRSLCITMPEKNTYQPAITCSKLTNRNTTTRCEICSKLTIKTPKQPQWRHSGVFIINFEHISRHVLVFLSLTLNR